jgi:predicted 3-demethylubiquinone-9 3-methyltransferase (glyoxalase superfamily)
MHAIRRYIEQRRHHAKITPCLWSNGQAEQAMQFYTSIFKNARAGIIMRYGEAGPGRRVRHDRYSVPSSIVLLKQAYQQD